MANIKLNRKSERNCIFLIKSLIKVEIMDHIWPIFWFIISTKKYLNWDWNIHPKFIQSNFYGQIANVTNYPENLNLNKLATDEKRNLESGPFWVRVHS